VVKCHSRALRRLTVPMLEHEDVTLACAVADCRAIEALDLTPASCDTLLLEIFVRVCVKQVPAIILCEERARTL
jgi:hypothetical protein